jgi:hypothetical protein
MRKPNILLIIALAAAMLASFTIGQVGNVSAQEVPPTGVVIDYMPGQSITIVDQNGMQHQYMISDSVKILPPVRSNSLAVGSFVTIIAPASLSQGKEIAVGIVVHPQIPPGWNVPSLSPTPVVTSTLVETSTALPTDTLPASETATETLIGTQIATDTATATETQVATDTATATETPTGTELATDTATATETPTSVETATDTPTATATPVGGGTDATTNALIEWLRSLFQQILTSR